MPNIQAYNNKYSNTNNRPNLQADNKGYDNIENRPNLQADNIVFLYNFIFFRQQKIWNSFCNRGINFESSNSKTK